MSTVVNCLTCGAKAKYKEKEGKAIYKGLTDEQKGKKYNSLKKQ